MQSTQVVDSDPPTGSVHVEEVNPAPTYTTTARQLHWWTAGLVAVQIPIGLYMANHGNALNIPDGSLGKLFSTHKLLGTRDLLSCDRAARVSVISRNTAGRTVDRGMAEDCLAHQSLGTLPVAFIGTDRGVHRHLTLPLARHLWREAACVAFTRPGRSRACLLLAYGWRVWDRSSRRNSRDRRGISLLHAQRRGAQTHVASGRSLLARSRTTAREMTSSLSSRWSNWRATINACGSGSQRFLSRVWPFTLVPLLAGYEKLSLLIGDAS